MKILTLSDFIDDCNRFNLSSIDAISHAEQFYNHIFEKCEAWAKKL